MCHKLWILVTGRVWLAKVNEYFICMRAINQIFSNHARANEKLAQFCSASILREIHLETECFTPQYSQKS